MSLVLLFVFFLRLLLAFLPSFTIDMNAWMAWAARLSSVGPWLFYTDEVWTNYTPGFLYWLWFLGENNIVTELAIKLPTIVAEVLTGVLIWTIVKKKSRKLAFLAIFLYSFSLPAIFLGSVWGQIDGLLAFLLFLSAFLMIERKKLLLSWAVFAFAFLVKPQAVVFLPTLTAVSWSSSRGETLKGTFFALLVLVFLSLPFFPNDPLFGFFKMISQMGSDYPYTSVFAFNLWSIYPGFWISDNQSIFSVPYFYLGAVLLVIFISLIVLLGLKRAKSNPSFWYLIFGLSYYAFFLFPTRIHERYLFPAFAFLLVYAFLSRKIKSLLLVYLGLSVVYFLNLYYPYAYYNDNVLKSPWLTAAIESNVKIIAVLLLSFFGVYFWQLLKNNVEVKKV